MSRQIAPATGSATGPTTGLNQVSLTGRLTAAPTERELPSGDVICTFRISVPRSGRTPMTARSTHNSDWVDCVAAGARVRRSTRGWEVGETVSVEGALRRRFYRAGDATGTRLELEVISARRAAPG